MGGGGACGEGGVSRLQARGGPLLEGGGQRLAALVANLVAVEIEPLEPRRCPLLAEGGGQRLAALVANLVANRVERPDIPLLRNFSGFLKPFGTRLDLRAAQLKDLDLLLIRPGLGSWPAQTVKG